MALESTSEQSVAVPPPDVATPAILPGVPDPAPGAPVAATAITPTAEGTSPAVPPEGGDVVVVDPWEHVTFWQLPWVQNILPVAMSVLLHLVIIIIGFLTFKAVETVAKTIKEQVIIPEAAIVENQPVGGIPNPGLGGDPNLTNAQDQVQVQSEGWNDKKSETLSDSLMGAGETAATDSVIGIGQNTAGPGKGALNSGTGESGGPAAPYGLPGGGGGTGPKSPFMGISGNARKVVYICDASGTMMTVFPHVREELKRAVDVLKPIQSFNVIFFKDAETMTVSKTSLVVANPDNKRKAYAFAEGMSAAGLTDPIPSIKLAFQQQPDLLYILTDGFDNIDDFDAVIKLFRDLNKDKKVKVNCILIRSAQDVQLEKVLRTIASENGGVLKILDKNDF